MHKFKVGDVVRIPPDDRLWVVEDITLPSQVQMSLCEHCSPIISAGRIVRRKTCPPHWIEMADVVDLLSL